MLNEVIENGKALEKFKVFIENQGGDPSVVDNADKLPQASKTFEVISDQTGYVEAIGAEGIGIAASMLGAGRAVKEDVIDLAVGIVIHKKVGDKVENGDVLATLYANTDDVEKIKEMVLGHYVIGSSKKEIKLIEKIITD